MVFQGGPITFNADGSLMNNSSAVAGSNVTVTMALTNGAQTPFDFALNFGTDNNAAAGGIGLRDGLTGDDGNGTFDPITGAYLPKQTAYASFVDGYPDGTLTGFSVNQTGGIDVSFSNNQTIEFAKLAMTAFDNPEGLERTGSNYFRQSANSGLGRVGTAGSQGFGITLGGALEASNVDLTVELTNMIVAQRMFESSARIVTAADRVLDTLVNLGR
jgi:flagellar hook protein FlgE